MKAVLISIQPQWCAKIASGEKTIEVRKTKPKIATPFKVYIYCTLPPREELFGHGGIYEYANELIRLQSGEVVYDYGMRLCCDPDGRPYTSDNFLCRKVIGEFVCDRIFSINVFNNGTIQNWNCNELEKSCVPYDDIVMYIGNNRSGYGWHISERKIYDKPKELTELYKPGTLSNGDFEYQLYDGSGDPSCSSYASYLFTRAIRKAPQSWCYVEG